MYDTYEAISKAEKGEGGERVKSRVLCGAVVKLVAFTHVQTNAF